jgi:hypothetical protein
VPEEEALTADVLASDRSFREPERRPATYLGQIRKIWKGQGGVVMALTGWTNSISGKRLDDAELGRLQEQAHRLYEANPHIFEDEREALGALGVVSLWDALREKASFEELQLALSA